MAKKKILTISDSPLGNSGVGIQAKLFIEALLKTGKYSFLSFAGAIEHKQYNPIRFKEWGEDWTVFPVNGFGTPEMIRSAVFSEKIDMIWFMGDPRFFYWLFANSLEVRTIVPVVFYTIWDNYPIPKFNVYHYGSVDAIVSQSLVTKDIVEQVAPTEVLKYHVPLTVDTKSFFIRQDPNIPHIRKQISDGKDRFIFFWNNRNARRKHPATLMMWFKKFAQQVEEKYGKEKAPILVMHTNPVDQAGHDLHVVFRDLELDGYVKFSNHTERPLSREELSVLYNAVDCTINIADAEGFGLSVGESLSCGVPVIATKTGGMQEQMTDGQNVFGVSLEPKSRVLVGSLDVPYIYEDRVLEDDFIEACWKMYEMSKEDRDKLGALGRQHIESTYGIESFTAKWQETAEDIFNKCGSWEERKNFSRWKMEKL